MLRRGGWSVLGVCGLLYLAAACGGRGRGGDPGSTPGGGTSVGAGSSGGPTLGSLGGSESGATGGTSGRGEDCAAERVEAQRLPLDMYIMLDVSGSMLVPTEGDQSVTKWEAVSSALSDFVSDPGSAGIGVGLQVFPLRHPDAPESCVANADCAGFESCFLKMCWNSDDALLACNTDRDCGILAPQGSCVTFGVCANDDYVCRAIGQPCGEDENGQDLGDCQPAPPSQCTLTADCRAASYAAPAAEIAVLPGAAPALVAVLGASTPDPGNLTPTGPALEGAIRQAKAWASAHLDHQVVAVLATDGQPTLRTAATTCSRVQVVDDLQEVVDFAGDGASTAPAISTFVLGVLSTEDLASGASTVLDGIAEAGATEKAFIIDTRGDVQTEFRSALEAIRARGLSCELKVPAGEAGKPVSYDEVNVDFTNQGGTTEGLFRVANASSCADAPRGRGWYYDTVPAETKPSRITVCPSVCNEFQTVDMGSVSIALGCEQRSVVK